MTQPATSFTLESQAISDRGLNERRPLNEDSFLADSVRRIFVVADGVGGAEAGEVASQTAVEVLDEAFRHQEDGADIEDLMELAIQRANASIHQMAQDNARFSMMATTVVALHLKGNVATIGHVGDSRLYRLTREGDIIRLDARVSGVIESIGLYSTRILTADNTHVIVPNRRLADAEIERAFQRPPTQPHAAVPPPSGVYQTTRETLS